VFAETYLPVALSGFPLLGLGSINIGHGSPPKLSVTETSQLNLSLCLVNTSPFLYNLA